MLLCNPREQHLVIEHRNLKISAQRRPSYTPTSLNFGCLGCDLVTHLRMQDESGNQGSLMAIFGAKLSKALRSWWVQTSSHDCTRGDNHWHMTVTTPMSARHYQILDSIYMYGNSNFTKLCLWYLATYTFHCREEFQQAKMGAILG